ncbi:hypothetical protein M378DRAFT_737418 [Amanita muscaria Koide BX008]|uniref:Uncharacterized protein n=1 Tax=Amanita muscaria (strain Koide BX008) TaxID=946122 RepID=A0A0C2RWN2_AMAMK|nr:hypothetical protein M378DRAFT_737418 [Amanita muscaria Koide BX008]
MCNAAVCKSSRMSMIYHSTRLKLQRWVTLRDFFFFFCFLLFFVFEIIESKLYCPPKDRCKCSPRQGKHFWKAICTLTLTSRSSL